MLRSSNAPLIHKTSTFQDFLNQKNDQVSLTSDFDFEVI